ncbi:MAG: hypothetical protein AB7V27_01090 [Candidatus Binatia bacterium]
MTLAGKQRLVFCVLSLLAAWPLAHMALVARYHIDPWRFFGWAMYCTPKFPVQMTVYEVVDGRRARIALRDFEPALRRSARRLMSQRLLWGRLAPVDRFGHTALATRPAADAIEVGVSHWYLDPSTARIAARRDTYRYTREARALAPSGDRHHAAP